jgi:hypothetical protein
MFTWKLLLEVLVLRTLSACYPSTRAPHLSNEHVGRACLYIHSKLDLQDVQEVANFFERRVSAYQVGVRGEVVLDAAF